jgi:branched-chain amino acid transport system permease protein
VNAQLDNTRSVAGWLRRVWPHLALPIALAVMVLAVSEDGYYRHLATAGCIAYVLTSSFNLVFGYAGIFSLASVALYGVGAYASVYAENNWGWSFWLAIVFAFVLSAALGGAIAAPTARLRSIFIAIVTLAFAVAVTEVFSKWTSVTGGAAGIYSITPPSIGETSLVGGTTEYLWLCAVVAWLVGDLMLRIHRSALGRKLVALRETPNVLPTVGVDAARLRLLAFVVSSGLAGLAGALYAHFQLTIAPEAFGIHRLIELLLATVIGGAGSFLGPFLGVGVLLGLDELGIHMGDNQPLVYGVAVIFLMTFGRKGVAGWISSALAWRREKAHRSAESGTPAASHEQRTVTAHERPVRQPATGEPVLDLQDVTVRFGGVVAVKEVSLSVRPGEVVGLIGPNGAGKTSLLNAITAEVPVTSGAISLKGESLIGQRKHSIRQAGIARTFQVPALVPDLSILENVMLGGEVHSRAGFLGQLFHSRKSRRDDEIHHATALENLTEVGVGRYADGDADSQPYGVLRLAEIARGLALDPGLLLLDEPGAGLTENDLEDLLHVIEQLRSQGRSVILIDHHVGFVVRAADRMVVMNQGAVLAEGTPDEVLANRDVIEAYLGEAAL